MRNLGLFAPWGWWIKHLAVAILSGDMVGENR